MRALPSDDDQIVGQSPAVGGGDPAAEADAGGGDHDVGVHVDQRLGVDAQLAVVGQRDHLDGRRAGDAGAALAQQRTQFVGAAGGGHRHPESGERRPLGLIHVSSVCSRMFPGD